MTNQFLPSYTIGTDAYDSVYDVCHHFGKTAVLSLIHISEPTRPY